jgi:membrane protease YdiL (CAAX protease family)
MEEAATSGISLVTIITAFLLTSGLITAVLCFFHHRRNPPNCSELTGIMIARSWDTLQVGILLATLFLLYFLASFTGLLLYEEQIPAARLGITILIYAILITVIAIINRKRGVSWPDSLGMGLGNLRKLLIAPVLYLAAIPFIMLLSKGWHLLLQLFLHAEPELQEVAKIVSRQLSWLEISYMFMAIFAAPVYEELLFRGIVFPYLIKRVGLTKGIVVISLLFALIHFHLPSVVPLALLSAALCLAYWRTGSLWVSIGMHMIFNAVTILVLNVVAA